MSSKVVGTSSPRSRVGLAVVLALTLVSTTVWGRGGGGFGGGGHGGGHFGGGSGGGHFAGRPLGEPHPSDRFGGGGRFPHLDHGPDISRHLYTPFYAYGYYGPGYWYGAYCDLPRPTTTPRTAITDGPTAAADRAGGMHAVSAASRRASA